jgi:hypothetical protein
MTRKFRRIGGAESGAAGSGRESQSVAQADAGPTETEAYAASYHIARYDDFTKDGG